MKIFFICKVRGVKPDSKEYAIQRVQVEKWERAGHSVHWPHRDTKQEDPEHGTEICRTTFWKILEADVVCVRFDPTSEGWLADIMMAFALDQLARPRGAEVLRGVSIFLTQRR